MFNSYGADFKIWWSCQHKKEKGMLISKHRSSIVLVKNQSIKLPRAKLQQYHQWVDQSRQICTQKTKSE